MRIKQIHRSSVKGDEVRIEVTQESDNTELILMSADVAAQLMSGLFDAAQRLLRAGVQRNAPVYEMIGCRSVTTAQNEQGLALTMKPGFDIVLTLTPEVAAILKSCIRQIEKDHQDGQVH